MPIASISTARQNEDVSAVSTDVVTTNNDLLAEVAELRAQEIIEDQLLNEMMKACMDMQRMNSESQYRAARERAVNNPPAIDVSVPPRDSESNRINSPNGG